MNIAKVVILNLLLYLGTFLGAQNALIAKIIDANTKENLIYCHVINLTSRVTCITNEEGEFRINDARPNDSLLISYLGYNHVKMTVADAAQKHVIKLKPNAALLTEVQIPLNDKKLLEMVKDCSGKLNKSKKFQSKAYLELYCEDDSTHLELLQMYFNVVCRGGHISDFLLKAGRVALTSQEEKQFINLGSTQALILLNPTLPSFLYPLNPLVLTEIFAKDLFYIKRLSDLDENGVVHIEFEPKILKDSARLFSGEMFIRKSDNQLLKLNLNINNSRNHPFLPVSRRDSIASVSINLNYYFNKIGNDTRLTLVDFTFKLKYLSGANERKEMRNIKTEGLLQLYDDSELFTLPFFEFDNTKNDYRKMSLIPTDSLFWQRNKTLQVTEKQQKRYELFAKDGILLNFNEIENDINPASTKGDSFDQIFEHNNIIWRKSAIVRMKPNVNAPIEKTDIVVQLFLDINKFGDSLYHNSHTVFDVFKTQYYLENKPEHLAYVNIYFDLCEIIRREMVVELNKTQDINMMKKIYKETNKKLKKMTKSYKNEMKFGRNILNFSKWNEKVKAELGRDHLKYFKVDVSKDSK